MRKTMKDILERVEEALEVAENVGLEPVEHISILAQIRDLVEKRLTAKRLETFTERLAELVDED